MHSQSLVVLHILCVSFRESAAGCPPELSLGPGPLGGRPLPPGLSPDLGPQGEVPLPYTIVNRLDSVWELWD